MSFAMLQNLHPKFLQNSMSRRYGVGRLFTTAVGRLKRAVSEPLVIGHTDIAARSLRADLCHSLDDAGRQVICRDPPHAVST